MSEEPPQAQSAPPSGATTTPIVQVCGVSKIYRLREETVYALKKVDLTIYQGEYLSIMGPSGSGKSTLFNIVGALDKASEGYAQIGDLRLTELSPSQLSHVRCNYIGYVFQAFNLIPSLSALRNVSLPRIFMGASPEEADAKAAEVLESVGLGHRLTHTPDELSGGQQQRVAIARALINEPVIILADEPTANLDLNTGSDVIKILKNLSVEKGVTIITATHDHKMLSQSDRVVRIREGEIEAIQTRDELEIEEGTIEFSH
ncbi:MAG: ABC transporter ATP-binding protein [Kiritimatiellae bacterium]|nr:ABC transporter ATP-binding protein [Kiritimatiellia bacterium]